LGVTRSRSRVRRSLGTALLVAVSAVAIGVPAVARAGAQATEPGTGTPWLQPPRVLPIPSRTGPEGPPRPFGREPPPGRPPVPTSPRLLAAQDRALLSGPFPSNGLVRGISDGSLLLSEAPSIRAFAETQARAAGATVIRIPVDWRDRVLADPPPGFDPGDPASPAYQFELIDAAIRDTVAAGLRPLLVVSHAPAFAEAPHRWPYAFPGSWAPSPGALKAFAQALARRYDGSFPDPLTPGRALPRVSMFQAWNEPNLARYLEPQWVVSNGRWSAFSPLLYRQMLNAFYAGIKSVEPTDLVVAAGLAPLGDSAGFGRMAPVSFLRELLCLQPTMRRRCADPPHFNVLAFHPLSDGNPDLPAASSLDVGISDTAKITTPLHEAERLHTALPAGDKPVWVTELNWESAPQSPHGVPAEVQAFWISRALHRLWSAGVQLVDWQFLVDPYPALQLDLPTGGTVNESRPAGLFSDGASGVLNAQPKPFLRGFTLPFDPLRLDRRQVRVWALLMNPGQSAVLERARGERWVVVASLRAEQSGVINTLIHLSGAGRVRLMSGALVSAEARVGR
jgi:hypothetical protein